MTPRAGGCLCGAVRYECGGEPQFSLQCHCRDCQRQSGAPHVAAVRMPSAWKKLNTWLMHPLRV